jgi:formamidopyrimidine-DNA glycosylase
VPELPEVETIVRLIRPRLEGRTIVAARVRWTRTLGGLRPERFRQAVLGARVTRVWRRAKYAVFDLERAGRPAGHLVGHLRMSGRFHVEAADFRPGPHLRLSLQLDDGRSFHFIDVRKFGRLIYTEDWRQPLRLLGPEPLESAFTAEWLHAALRQRRRQLKPLLLDQGFLAGLGNIYVDEVLHAARLHPLRLSDHVAQGAATRLHAAIRRTLSRAIEREGSSFDTFYRTPEGQPGQYQEEFRVYGRDGQPCPVCRTRIRRLLVGQRGTHVCPRCQPAPRRRASQGRMMMRGEELPSQKSLPSQV